MPDNWKDIVGKKTLDIKFALLDQVFADVQLPSELQIQLESEENVERT